MLTTPLRIAVLLSGTGRTLVNLNDHISAGLPARVVRVISTRPDVLGVERARLAGIPVEIISRKSFDSVSAFSEAIFQVCRIDSAELVCLAGFLQRLRIPADFAGRVMNIHPSLLPAFGGKGMYGHHVHEAVLEHGVKWTGCTVHFVDDEYDQGPIILQRIVPVLQDDTAEILAERVFAQECAAYPEAIRLFAEGRLRVAGRRVICSDGTTFAPSSLCPQLNQSL
jgi:formyltetrahydrofolate-dependent phosphoribosylglycinamide formyltransferase